jgi:hypothetical protein
MIVEVVQKGKLYKLIKVVQSLVANYNTKQKKNDLWHRIFKHFFMYSLRTLPKNNFVEGMDLNGDHDLSFYDRYK